MEAITLKHPLQDIEVILPTDPDFNGDLSKYVGGNQAALSIVEAVKPLGLFIRNTPKKALLS